MIDVLEINDARIAEIVIEPVLNSSERDITPSVLHQGIVHDVVFYCCGELVCVRRLVFNRCTGAQ